MPWYVFALLASVCLSGATLLEKRTLGHVRTFPYSLAQALLNAVLTLPLLAFLEWDRLSLSAVLLTILAGALAAIALLDITRGVRHLDISTTQPLLSAGPAITAVVAFLLLGEALTRLQALGIALVTAGIYLLETRPHASWVDPLRFFLRSRYARGIFIGLFIFAFTSLIDRYVLGQGDVPVLSYLVLLHLSIAVHFAAAALLVGRGSEEAAEGFRQSGWVLVPVSVLHVAARFFQMTAVAVTPVGLVVTLKRTSGLLTTLVGGELFHEKNLVRKAIAAFVIVAGSVVIVLS